MGIKIEQLVNYPVNCLAFSPFYTKNEEISDIFSSLSFVVGTYTNILLDL